MGAQGVVIQRGPSADVVRSKRRPTKASVLAAAALLGFAAPAIAYLLFIHQYGVDVPVQDQWVNFTLLGHSFAGTLSFGDLWAQHVTERMLFPNLIVLLLGHATHFNLFVEMYLSAILLFAATGFIILAHKRRSPSTPWIFYCPVALMMWSFAQFEDALWGFQIAWYLIIAAFGVAVFLLDGPKLSWLALAGAAVAAIVGSYSSIQGLFIWVAGWLLLYQRRRSRQMVLAWLIVAVATAVGYFHNYVPISGRYYWVHHPVTTIKLFFLAIGTIIAQPTPNRGDNAYLLVGMLIFLIGAWVVIRFGLRRDESTAAPIGVALICFGVVFAAAVAVGTVSFFGAWLGTGSRYAPNVLLIPVGSYLVLLPRPVSRTPSGSRAAVGWGPVRVCMVGVVCLQVVLGTINGIQGGRKSHQTRLVAANVVVNIEQATIEEIWYAIFWPPPPGSIALMRSHHLSLFGTSAASSYAREGLAIAPTFLAFSPSGRHVLVVHAHAFSEEVITNGVPPPAIVSRNLPPSLVLVDHHNGTATLSGVGPLTRSARFALSAVNKGGRFNQVFFLIVKG